MKQKVCFILDERFQRIFSHKGFWGAGHSFHPFPPFHLLVIQPLSVVVLMKSAFTIRTSAVITSSIWSPMDPNKPGVHSRSTLKHNHHIFARELFFRHWATQHNYDAHIVPNKYANIAVTIRPLCDIAYLELQEFQRKTAGKWCAHEQADANLGVPLVPCNLAIL